MKECCVAVNVVYDDAAVVIDVVDDSDVLIIVVVIIFVLVVVVIVVYQYLLVTECSPSGSGHIQLCSSQQAELNQRPVGSNTSTAL